MSDEKVIPICTSCGSAGVTAEASLYFDTEKQEWVIDDVFDDHFCDRCNDECDVKFVGLDSDEAKKGLEMRNAG